MELLLNAAMFRKQAHMTETVLSFQCKKKFFHSSNRS